MNSNWSCGSFPPTDCVSSGSGTRADSQPTAARQTIKAAAGRGELGIRDFKFGTRNFRSGILNLKFEV
jgi:hypothetical protein